MSVTEEDIAGGVGGDGCVDEDTAVIRRSVRGVVGEAVEGKLGDGLRTGDVGGVAVVDGTAGTGIVESVRRGKGWRNTRGPVVRRENVVGGGGPLRGPVRAVERSKRGNDATSSNGNLE